MTSVTLYIPQMEISGEEAVIHNQLASLPGVLGLNFNLPEQEVKITYQNVDISYLKTILASVGITAIVKRRWVY